MPGSAMPPWGHLPVADLNALVAHVRKLHGDAVIREFERAVEANESSREDAATAIAERTQPGPALRIPPETDFDSLGWFEGRRIYLEACASCHGVDGHPVASAVKFDDEGYPDPPRSFVNGIFKGGAAGHQLYARVIKGMRGTPMPAFEGNYTDDQAWDLIHYVQTLARSGAQERAELRREAIVAAPVANLPDSPSDASWERARAAYVGLTPLWWTENRIEGLTVQALHDGKELAFRFSWIDPTIDSMAVKTEQFRDAVAIQFSLASDPPFYMGAPGEGGGVNMWMWKADRQANLAKGYQDVDAAYPNRAVDMYQEQNYQTIDKDIGEEWPTGKLKDHNPKFITAWGAGNTVANPLAKTSVESLIARGPGTLASLPHGIQRVQGKAIYERGVWTVQMRRGLDAGQDERAFSSGDYIPVSFAIWNGNARDRDGKKNISIWQRLVIE